MNKERIIYVNIFLLLLSLFYTGLLYAAEYSFATSKRVSLKEVTRDDLPEGIIKIVERIKTDPEMDFGPMDRGVKYSILRCSKTLEDYTFDDIEVGVPLPKYHFKKGALEESWENKALDEMIKPYSHNYWKIPVLAKGEYILYIEAYYKDNRWKVYGNTCCWNSDGYWDSMEKQYPKGLDENPVLVRFNRKGYIFFMKKSDNRKVIRQRQHYDNDGSIINRLKAESKDNLMDPKDLIPYWRKEKEKAQKASEKFLKRHPNALEILKKGGTE